MRHLFRKNFPAYGKSKTKRHSINLKNEKGILLPVFCYWFCNSFTSSAGKETHSKSKPGKILASRQESSKDHQKSFKNQSKKYPESGSDQLQTTSSCKRGEEERTRPVVHCCSAW